MLTVLGNALVGSSAPALAAEVGAARNTASNLGSAIGTAIAGTLLIVLLAGQIQHTTPPELRGRVKLHHVQFISNQQLQRAAAHAGLSKHQVDQAVRINTTARLTALRLSFFALAGLSALAAITTSALADPRQAAVPETERAVDAANH